MTPPANLYGTTQNGGPSNAGTVFIVDPTGILMATCTGPTYYGGNQGAGTVFKVNTVGQETVLHNFTSGNDGWLPLDGNLVRDSAGNLYGTTPPGGFNDFGAVFKIDTQGNDTVLHTFSGSDGKIPYKTLFLDEAENLYGTTYEGGAYGGGVVFKIAP